MTTVPYSPQLNTPEESLQVSIEQPEILEQLLAIGTALSGTYNLDELLNLILTKCREITWSDAGSVYLVDRQEGTPSLWFKAAQNASRPEIALNEFALPITAKSLVGYVTLTGNSLNLPDAYYLPPGVPYALDGSFDQSIGYRTRSVLVLPMQNADGEVIGVLQLINRKLHPGVKVTPENACEVTQAYSLTEERILRSLASQAAISIERNHLQGSIEKLFEGFVRASVQVIESRDPCTSGHSERVAGLTVRLSQVASSLTSGPLQWIQFTPQQIQEIRYAALLHDFGKVGVPEAILSKEKKFYPHQLEVIRHRFQLVQRTLELDCAQAKFKHLIEHPSHLSHESHDDCSHCSNIHRLDQQLEQAIEQLDDYWELLLEANEPRLLAEEPLKQLQELACYTYRDVDGQLQPLISPAELAQLMVPRGSLTPQERSQVEYHVTHTYEFLKRIPWTKPLQEVPRIAFSHHEKLDGSGYPLGLTAAQIPIQAQIMTVADIYDALTAGDRPYKRSIPVQAAIRILHEEARQNKLNQELVHLFEQQQVYTVLGHTLE